MESGLRDRNNLWEKVATYCINDVSQWSPVLETGTIKNISPPPNQEHPVSMESGLRDRNNTKPTQTRTSSQPTSLNGVRS